MKCKSVFRKNIKFKCCLSSVISDFHLERIEKKHTYSFQGMPKTFSELAAKLPELYYTHHIISHTVVCHTAGQKENEKKNRVCEFGGRHSELGDKMRKN